jgi:hypothetical protein
MRDKLENTTRPSVTPNYYEWLREKLSASTPETASANPTEAKNNARTHFTDLSQGDIFLSRKVGEDIRKTIRIPVNPHEDPRWSKFAERHFAASFLDLPIHKATVEAALYLIAQAIQYDISIQRKEGSFAGRDQALKAFGVGGHLHKIIVSQDQDYGIDCVEEAVLLGEETLKDYFRTVSAVILVGALTELALETRPAGYDVHSRTSWTYTLQSSHEMAADRIGLVRRYIQALESGSPEDRYVWDVAIRYHEVDCRYDADVLRCAIPLVEVTGATARSFFAQRNASGACESDLQRHRDFFKDILEVLNDMQLPFAIAPFVVEKMKEASCADTFGFREAIVSVGGKVQFNPAFFSSLGQPKMNVRYQEGRDQLMDLVVAHQDLWGHHLYLRPDAVLERLSGAFDKLFDHSDKFLGDRERYRGLFEPI